MCEVPQNKIRSLSCIMSQLFLSMVILPHLAHPRQGTARGYHSICDMRLCEPATSPYRMKDICDQIPLTLEGLPLDETGYHQTCYKSFTGKLGGLKVSETSISGESSSSSIEDSLRRLKSSQISLKGLGVSSCLQISAFSVTK